MEVTHVGVRNRARAMVTKTENTVDYLGAVKRRKMIRNEKVRSPSLPFVQTRTTNCEIYISSVLEVETIDPCYGAANFRSSGVSACCCSSTELPENQEISDLEESDETGPAATDTYDPDISESIPEKEVKAQSGELESTTGEQSSATSNFFRRAILSAEKMPPEAELEEFFAEAQEGLNKRFKNKYNYDIINDIPLKGPFEWIQVVPGK